MLDNLAVNNVTVIVLRAIDLEEDGGFFLS